MQVSLYSLTNSCRFCRNHLLSLVALYNSVSKTVSSNYFNQLFWIGKGSRIGKSFRYSLGANRAPLFNIYSILICGCAIILAYIFVGDISDSKNCPIEMKTVLKILIPYLSNALGHNKVTFYFIYFFYRFMK